MTVLSFEFLVLSYIATRPDAFGPGAMELNTQN